MEEKKVNWFVEKKNKFVEFCKARPELTLTVLGGLFTVIGAGINCYTVIARSCVIVCAVISGRIGSITIFVKS